jgi:transcriptional regulator with XRE-family HTH domain
MDVAGRAGVGCETVSRLERGELEGMTVATLRAISRALRMPPIVSLGWRHPEIDQLRDKRHAAMVEAVVAELQGKGWEAAPEHSFSHFGERGAVDTLGWHAESRTLLVVEVKTRIWDVQDTLSTLDRKRRLIPVLASGDRGWNAASVGVLLVLPEGSSHRHLVERHAATFRAVLPRRQLEVRHWLARPSGGLRGIWFLPISHHTGLGQGRVRVRLSRSPIRGG